MLIKYETWGDFFSAFDDLVAEQPGPRSRWGIDTLWVAKSEDSPTGFIGAWVVVPTGDLGLQDVNDTIPTAAPVEQHEHTTVLWKRVTP